MKPPYIVIGSGPAGFAAARKLVQLGHRPILIEVGARLDTDRSALVRERSETAPAAWDAEKVQKFEVADTGKGPFPMRMAFGSDFPYAEPKGEHPFVAAPDQPPRPSYAMGGLSNVWSASVLPAHEDDMAEWPIDQRELLPHYRQALQWMPLSAGSDELQREFPILKDSHDRLTLPPVSSELLDRLQRRASSLSSQGIYCGRSRLAVAGDSDPTSGCRYCGECHSGCVYRSIWSPTTQIDALAASGALDYRPGMLVRSVVERDGEVDVHCDLEAGGSEVVTGSRVYIAAGAINSTRIVLESLGLWSRPVRLLSTQGFVAPMIPAWSAPRWPTRMTLASLFIEFKIPDSDHWVHTQIGPVHELASQQLARLVGDHLPVRYLRAQMERRLLLAVFNLHSDHAGHHILKLERRPTGPSVLELTTVPNHDFPRRARKAAILLGRALMRCGVMTIPPVGPVMDTRPLSWHVGASLPMRSTPHDDLDTDPLGRPKPWSHVHVVDSSVFTSVPGTTVALLAMANAIRIVDESVRSDPTSTARA